MLSFGADVTAEEKALGIAGLPQIDLWDSANE